MGEQENVETYRQFITEACSPSDLDRMDDFLAPGIELPTIGEGGVRALKEMHGGLRAAFPDLSARIDEVVSNGDWVAARLTWTGTHRGRFVDIEPSGRAIEVTEVEIVRIVDGRIVEVREVADLGGMLSQISS